MKITVKTTVDTAKLAAIDAAAQRALALTAEVIHGQVVQAQVMPFRTGHLQNESTFVDTSGAVEGHVDIVSATPYARRLYYHPEYNFDTTNNPSAGGMWFEPWANGEYSESATATFAALLKREAGL